MPAYLFAHLQAQYGAKSLVQVRSSAMQTTPPPAGLWHRLNDPGFCAGVCVLRGLHGPPVFQRGRPMRNVCKVSLPGNAAPAPPRCSPRPEPPPRCCSPPLLVQEWDTPVLRVFLDATERISTYGALVHPCCEYPDTYFPGRGMPPWLCTWKVSEKRRQATPRADSQAACFLALGHGSSSGNAAQ